MEKQKCHFVKRFPETNPESLEMNAAIHRFNTWQINGMDDHLEAFRLLRIFQYCRQLLLGGHQGYEDCIEEMDRFVKKWIKDNPPPDPDQMNQNMWQQPYQNFNNGVSDIGGM